MLKDTNWNPFQIFAGGCGINPRFHKRTAQLLVRRNLLQAEAAG
jgi:hypothetical protein